MDTSLITAMLGAQAGAAQLAVAARLERMKSGQQRFGGQTDRRRAAEF